MRIIWQWPLVAILYVFLYTWHWLSYPFLTRTHYKVCMCDLKPFPTMGSATKKMTKRLAKIYSTSALPVTVSRTPTMHPDEWRWTFKYMGLKVVVTE